MDRLTLDYWKSQLSEQWIETMKLVHRDKDIEQGILNAFGDLMSNEKRLQNADASDFKRLVNSWLANQRRNKQEMKTRINLDRI